MLIAIKNTSNEIIQEIEAKNLKEAVEKLADEGYLQGANLQGADLRGANLEGADLEGANLEGADLRGVTLRGANLEEADLHEADLRGADLQEADLQGANLQKTDLRGANLEGADLEEATLEGADLRGADLEEATLEGTNLLGATLKGSTLEEETGELIIQPPGLTAGCKETKMIKLTKLEQTVLRAACHTEYGDCRKDAQWSFAVFNASKLTGKMYRAAVSSLINKNLVSLSNYEGGEIFHLTDKGKKRANDF